MVIRYWLLSIILQQKTFSSIDMTFGSEMLSTEMQAWCVVEPATQVVSSRPFR